MLYLICKQIMLSVKKYNDISFIIAILDMGQHYHVLTNHKPVLALWDDKTQNWVCLLKVY